MNTVQNVLLEIRNHFGLEALSDSRRLLAYFSDLAPKLSRQRRVLGYFIECNGPELVLAIAGSSEREHKICIDRLVNKMNEDLMIDENASRMICEAFLCAVSVERNFENAVISEPDIHRDHLGEKPNLIAQGKEDIEDKIENFSETMISLDRVANLVYTYSLRDKYILPGSWEYNSDKKAENAISEYGYTERKADVMLVNDQSLLGSSKRGFMLTNREIIYNVQLSGRGRVPCGSIEEVSIKEHSCNS